MSVLVKRFIKNITKTKKLRNIISINPTHMQLQLQSINYRTHTFIAYMLTLGFDSTGVERSSGGGGGGSWTRYSEGPIKVSFWSLSILSTHLLRPCLTSFEFFFQPLLHDWCNKGRGVCYPVCAMMHIKEPLMLIRKSSPCGGSGFPLDI